MKSEGLSFKLNLTGKLSKCVTLSHDLSLKFMSSTFGIGSEVPPSVYGLPLEYSYKISGGSTVSGTPARRYVNSFNPIREKVRKRKRSLTVVSKFVTSSWAVADVRVSGSV